VFFFFFLLREKGVFGVLKLVQYMGFPQ